MPAPDVVPSVAAAAWEAVLAAEDARIETPEQLDAVRIALSSDNSVLRAMAVRALGRSERSEFLDLIAPLLSDGDDSVRIAAAHAVGDVTREARSVDARRMLLDELPQPGTGAIAAAAMLETLGRLAADSATASTTAARLGAFLDYDDPARAGALRGLYFLARQPAGRSAVGGEAGPSLRQVAVAREPAAGRADDAGASSASAGSQHAAWSARNRRLAISTLALARAADERTLMHGLQDADPQVRRESVAAAVTLADTAAVQRVTDTALRDVSPAVRHDALRVYGNRLAADRGCDPVAASVRDAAVHVALLAIDLLGTACTAPAYAPLLDSIASAGPDPDAWHQAAHAVVALSASDPARARPRIRGIARLSNAFARTYAARAAAAAGDTSLLFQLARDSSPNVRTAATAGLAVLAGHSADSIYIAQLASDDSELLMTAAAALEGSRSPDGANALIAALDRVTSLRRETSRDARIALLTRIQELGNSTLADRVTPYLTDFDAAVADRAAEVIAAWTGVRPDTAPIRLARLSLPTFFDAAAMARSTFVIQMADGSEIELRLLPFDAPANAFRFARLARAGWFDGLTFHRVVPSFVVQGGSPGANEYSGDGPFTRDELGVSNRRGTVGLSTRGRDTGDGQIFINLVDNVRLDHDYTVFADVIRGMDVVDALLEGAVIRNVRERAAR